MHDPKDVLTRLEALIDRRYVDRPADSYTTVLFDGGPTVIGDKVREEAGELAEAAQESGAKAQAQVIHEAADVVFHLLVLLRSANVTLDDISDELARREGVSGLAEKRSREPPPQD